MADRLGNWVKNMSGKVGNTVSDYSKSISRRTAQYPRAIQPVAQAGLIAGDIIRPWVQAGKKGGEFLMSPSTPTQKKKKTTNIQNKKLPTRPAQTGGEFKPKQKQQGSKQDSQSSPNALYSSGKISWQTPDGGTQTRTLSDVGVSKEQRKLPWTDAEGRREFYQKQFERIWGGVGQGGVGQGGVGTGRQSGMSRFAKRAENNLDRTQSRIQDLAKQMSSADSFDERFALKSQINALQGNASDWSQILGQELSADATRYGADKRAATAQIAAQAAVQPQPGGLSDIEEFLMEHKLDQASRREGFEYDKKLKAFENALDIQRLSAMDQSESMNKMRQELMTTPEGQRVVESPPPGYDPEKWLELPVEKRINNIIMKLYQQGGNKDSGLPPASKRQS